MNNNIFQNQNKENKDYYLFFNTNFSSELNEDLCFNKTKYNFLQFNYIENKYENLIFKNLTINKDNKKGIIQIQNKTIKEDENIDENIKNIFNFSYTNLYLCYIQNEEMNNLNLNNYFEDDYFFVFKNNSNSFIKECEDENIEFNNDNNILETCMKNNCNYEDDNSQCPNCRNNK